MAYQLVETSSGKFAIDWNIVTRIIRFYVRAGLQNQYSETVTESQTSMNPLSWGLPDLQYVEVDWNKVNAETLTTTWNHSWQLAALSYQSVDALVRELKMMQAETHRLQDLMRRRIRAASAASWSQVEQAVSTYGAWADGARFVRDLSGSILIGASTAGIGIAGSGAVAIAGTGTLLKSVGKYQDTGNIGSAAIEAGQNIIFAVVPPLRGAALAGKEKVAKVIISAAADTSKALLEGRAVGTAVMEGSINFVLPAVSQVAKSKPVQVVLDKTIVPVVTKVLTGPSAMTTKLPTGVMVKVAEDRLKKAGQKQIRAEMDSNPLQNEAHRLQARPATDTLVDALTFEEGLLLKFAIVDMTQGVGRSWW